MNFSIFNIRFQFMRYLILPAFSLALLLSVSVFSTSCETTTVDPTETSHYPEQVDAILRVSCATEDCHKGPNAAEELDLSSWEALYNGSNLGAVLVPYSPDWSHVAQHINTFTDLGIRATPVMPPSPATPLSRDQVLTIRNWIEQGAPDNKGNYYWAEQELSGKRKVFVLNANSDLVSVSDLATNKIMRMIPVGQLDEAIEAPHYIELSPDGQFFYITLIRGGIIEKYRTDNYQFEGRAVVGPDPAIMVLNTDGSILAVSHWNDLAGEPKISLVNTADMSIRQQIVGDGSLIDHPHGLTATSDFRTIYATAEWGNYLSKYTLDASFMIVEEEKIPLNPNDPVPVSSQSYGPYFMMLTPDESRIVISCNKENKVRVFQASNGQLLAAIEVGAYPRLMALDAQTNRIFVASRFEKNTAEQGSVEGCVSVVDLNSLSETARIWRVGHRPHGVAIDQATRTLYVSSENSGGIVPPHHPLEGNSFPPGHYNVVDLNTLLVNPDLQTELAEFPNALVITP
jgi:DNA-binding beta-propeller fold protein YncE